MKQILLCFFIAFSFSAFSQNNMIHTLPAGRYETFIKESGNKWQQGDIILIDANHYKISSNNEIGEYKFSATAQRIFFVSGPLKTVFAKTSINKEKPSIIIPAAENEQQGIKLAATDVVGYFRN